MTAEQFEYTEWQEWDVPVAELITWGGPEGSLEFDYENRRVRGKRPASLLHMIRRLGQEHP